jgi:hypothetical protein
VAIIAVLWLTFFLTSSSDAVGHANPARSLRSVDRSKLPLISVGVFAPRDISESLVNRICAEAESIWWPAGFTFEWRRITSTTTVRTWWLDVTIDEQHKDRRSLPGQAALGWIPFTAVGPQPSIHLSRSSAEELLRRTPGVEDKTIASHETLLGRALGRALSHELGHYFLSSNAHTPHGLMQAVRASEDFFRMGRDGFELTAEEREAAARHVQERPTEAEM